MSRILRRSMARVVSRRTEETVDPRVHTRYNACDFREPVMRRLIFISFLAACSGGSSKPKPDAANVDIGFDKPTKSLKANMETGGSWMDLGQADLSCLNTPSTDTPTTVAVALSTEVDD